MCQRVLVCERANIRLIGLIPEREEESRGGRAWRITLGRAPHEQGDLPAARADRGNPSSTGGLEANAHGPQRAQPGDGNAADSNASENPDRWMAGGR